MHLRPDHPERTDRFFEWLEAEAERANTVYLLGDLFDLWVGTGQMRDPFYRPIVDRLRDCVRRGARIEFVHGNRDFLIGRAFEKATGIRVHADPLAADFDDGTTLLTHGDLLCSEDRSYQRTRKLLRSRPVRAIGSILPLRAVLGIGAGLRKYSDRAVSRKSRETLEPPDEAILRMAAAGPFETILCGHLHRAFRREYRDERSSCELIVLGDWGSGGSYAVWEDGRYRLFVQQGSQWCEVS